MNYFIVVVAAIPCIKSRESERDEVSTLSSHGKAHQAAMFSLGQQVRK